MKNNSNMNFIIVETLTINPAIILNIKKGTLAPKAASEIHSDIERGFIKAEVFSYEDLMNLKSETAICPFKTRV